MTSANSSEVIVVVKDERWAEENLGSCRDSKKESNLACVN